MSDLLDLYRKMRQAHDQVIELQRQRLAAYDNLTFAHEQIWPGANFERYEAGRKNRIAGRIEKQAFDTYERIESALVAATIVSNDAREAYELEIMKRAES
jgi:hypothetical protein